jgi:hypothetical protein
MVKTAQLLDRRMMIVILSILLLGMLACGSASATATEAPAAKPTEAPVDEPEEETPSLEIINDTEISVCFVYLSPTKSDEWGDDQLGEENTIQPGKSFTLTDIPAGTYDLMAQDCDGYQVGVVTAADISEGGYTWTLETVSLTIENNSTSIGCNVYIVPPGTEQDDWGTSWTEEGAQIEPNGGTYTITGIPAGTYGLHIETCSGNYVWDWEEFDLTEDATATMSN